MDSKKSYQSMLKATTLFGGVQVVNILMALLRSKFIALYIGPAGMGVASLLMATLNVVLAITNLGLDRSGVKEIDAHESQGENDQKNILSVLKTLFFITEIIGVLLLLITAPWISVVTFGDNHYATHIRALSLALLFKQLTQSTLTRLQGLRRLKGLAKANVWGNFIALLVTIPLYYYWRIDAIVPAIILSALISFAVAQFVDARSKQTTVFTAPLRAWQEGTAMVRLGLMLSLSSIVTLLVGYGMQLFISGMGGLAQVGLYNAGFLILNTYVGLIFTAMGTDYFPRLSSVGEDLDKTKMIVGNQAEMATLLMLPIIVIFLATAPWIITLLYTPEFEAVVPLVRWGILGMLFKAVSFSLGYVIIARGDSSLFLRTTLSFNLILFTLNALGYYYWGLLGLGLSFFGYYIIHFLSLILIVRWRYALTLPRTLYAVFFLGLILCVLVFLLSSFSGSVLQIALTAILIAITCLFSLYRLNQRIDLVPILRRKKDQDSDEY